ncbi:hypothetical protein H828_YJM1478H00030 [Saccharomyces cerevisiae YJM1478]|uniref:K7_Yhl015w-ap n=2 Tax=Saccharomyces cerevisiae TaxID=4932 RepID=G2WF51_YEASK|nr:hypothetical protein H805_YJM1385H00034 [Saccharomyces cerevisiae YJM1385]AJU17826.1 hypothetical protein H808_YJM1388H00033 [Saccharomyces cerevisiae YJM1388]AJU18575.1 hypothetical protein H811_YJM1400H00032 [Saccharomyces cerevisiae YJM1400]AJU19073.1 hypothetical protein H813_YJM1402H00035 [Saccharomyces cerevisiae YJM1402]AJU20596.1 hypothetical protein H819_YJM1434H00034 [Saccharomyces cerevisiae YJM1434]AJU21088.1 hypothetical protein H821_YJM1443H00033 [Saccharomyces cerevisiae YJM1
MTAFAPLRELSVLANLKIKVHIYRMNR